MSNVYSTMGQTQPKETPAESFVRLCKNGKMEEARQLLISNHIDIFNEGYGKSCIFQKFCYDKYLNIAKWLLSIDNRPFSSIIMLYLAPTFAYRTTIQDELQCIFEHVCCDGEVETAKWLYSLGIIDPHADCGAGESVFLLSCRCGYIEIVKFILLLRNADKSASIGNKYEYLYEYKNYNNIAKFLFDHNRQARSTDDFVKLSDHLMERHIKLRESMMSALTDHLIPDIADLIYYYV
jgi:hypothetical protein